MIAWRTFRWLPLLLAPLGAAACEPEPADFPAQEDLASAAHANELIVLTPDGELLSARVEPDRVVGPQVSVGVFPGRAGRELRGVVFQRPVSLAITERGAKGLFGAMPVDLSVTAEDAGIHARGLVAGVISDYRIDGRRLSGTIGRCSYDLAREGPLYEGSRSCGGMPRPVRVRIPVALSGWGGPAQAALLGILLSS